MADTKDKEANGLQRFEKLREWGKLVVVVTALGAISWTVVKRDIDDNSKQLQRMDECIRDLRAELRRVSACGPRGLVDPEAHSSIDSHLDHYLRERLGLRGFRRLQDEYSTVPEFERPDIR
jgi:hypothetical protein